MYLHVWFSAASQSALMSALLLFTEQIWRIIIWWEKPLGPSLTPQLSPGILDSVGDKLVPLLSADTLHQGPAQAIRHPRDIQLARTKSAYCDSIFSVFGEAQQLHSVHLSTYKILTAPVVRPLEDETVDKSSTSRVALSHVLLLTVSFTLVNHCHFVPVPVFIQKQSSINASFISHVRPACRRCWKISCIRANLCATIIVPRIPALTRSNQLPHGLSLLPSLSRSGPICALQTTCRILAECLQNACRILADFL